jgi:multidrug efflux pump subunit AcrB
MAKRTGSPNTQLKRLQRLSLWFFHRPHKTALIWLVIALFGAASYSVFLKREGFPAVATPFAISTGSYLVHDPAKVDHDVAKPLSDYLLKQDGVKSVIGQSYGDFYNVIVNYKDGVNATSRSRELSAQVKSQHILPAGATFKIDPYKFGFTTRGDKLVVSFFSRNNSASTEDLVAKAKLAGDYIKNNVRSAVAELNRQPQFAGYEADVSASSAPQIKQQINTLQTTLLEGLLAVLVIGSIVIAVRASIITVLSMITVIAAANGLLFLLGYTLNTITLFALILGLSLIVDDTIIMVEALDKQRQRQKDPDVAVREATGRVSRAMIAATSTSVLSFAPLLFVGGILGSFIRAIPVTIIASLLISLAVALIFIPMFARYLLLGKKQMGESNVKEVAAGIEAAIARFVSGPMLWAKGSTKKLFLVGIAALVIGFGFIGAGGALFQKVTFNIFPNSKDSDQLSTVITFPSNTDINRAQQITDEVDKVVGQTVGANFKQASYYGMADIQTASLTTDITSYKQRDITAPALAKELNANFKDFKDARVESSILDVAGPPAAAFTVQVRSDTNRPAAFRAADDVANYIKNQAVLKRPDGRIAKIKNVSIGNSSIYVRKDGQAYVPVDVEFVDDDTTTLVTLAKDAIKKHYTPTKVSSFGLPKNAVQFDTGQEQENQDSFKTLALAFPILLLAIYFLLAFQFRSLLQPLLIFMALPFSIFGITLGLYATNNAFSFFTMLGFFALIGLSIKNTILLTDFANQSRRAGLGTVDAAHEAVAERFRPLIATSFTAVVSLIPLTLSDPFWEGLGVTLIFGLLSSTFLVITVFPYYYLGAEYLRQHINRRTGIAWLVLTVALAIPLKKGALLAPFIAVLLIKLVKMIARKRAT